MTGCLDARVALSFPSACRRALGNRHRLTLTSPPSCISLLHSGHASFLNTRPTFLFGQVSHQIFLQVGHCQS